eukprot:581859-Amphidinium_carterae.1
MSELRLELLVPPTGHASAIQDTPKKRRPETNDHIESIAPPSRRMGAASARALHRHPHMCTAASSVIQGWR